MPGIAYNETQVIQTALSLLGYDLIQSIDAGGPAAAAMHNMFDGLLAADLSSPNWRFATKAAPLSLIAGENPGFKWYTAAYQIPPDCLAIWQIWPGVPYEVFGEQIWTFGSDVPTVTVPSPPPALPPPNPLGLQIQYRHLAPLSMLPAAYIWYFTYLLAVTVAPGVTDDPKVIQLLQADMAKWRSQAMVANTQGRPNGGLTNSRWVGARASGTWYGSGYGGGGW